MKRLKLTYIFKLLKPTKYKENILKENIIETTKHRKEIVRRLKEGKFKLTTADFPDFKLSSAVKNQNIWDVKHLYKNFKKSKSKKENIDFKPNQPLGFSNQCYKIQDNFIALSLYDKKSKRIYFPIETKNKRFKEFQENRDNLKLGKMSIYNKKGNWYAALSVTVKDEKTEATNSMGIDIGLRQLAVISIMNEEGKEINRKFFSGNESGYIRRKYKALRRELGQAKKLKKIKEISNKEQNYIRDKNHKISHKIVELAVQGEVGMIIMENLKNIRNRVKSIKQPDRNINSWTFYQLQNFIEYKAKKEGIKVKYISPKYTSQKCSKCGQVEKKNRKKNLYLCECGNRIHSDLNAARNIASA
ncbi:RNA-guided endonuclease InsQ/TnpB family protein [Senegalia massiliensis]|uniref:RNA-guided endonuclease InsQ/TnpB family protein n=1 Tax=Senegalia massiliensis TaxID=1720316 RepID=UPI001A91FEA9|nr:RNA-guided endonuclease TnpB family protein [Senegalia massiliensis]